MFAGDEMALVNTHTHTHGAVARLNQHVCVGPRPGVRPCSRCARLGGNLGLLQAVLVDTTESVLCCSVI